MHYEGTVNIAAEREKVWAFLTDADFVSQCAPGIKAMEIVVPNEKYLAVASIGFGAVVAEFKAQVEFLEMKEPEFARVKAHGDSSDSAVDVTSEMHLTDGSNGSTDLAWSADIVVLGKIASVAARMMGSVTKKLTNKFFECVKDQIEA
jgi:carbon monoxide dehydrogenase subunit G